MARRRKEAVVEGLCIFSTKSELETLPSGAEVRYPLGIIANTASRRQRAL